MIKRYLKTEKKIMALLLAGLLILSSGCGKKEVETTEEEQTFITVGFSQLGAESDWRVANTESMRGSLTRQAGFDLIFDDAQQKQDKQIMAIRKFIQQEVDCILLAPVTETGWDTVLQEAKDAEIPVVIVDRMVDVEDTNLYTAWIGSDFSKEGEVACEWLNEFAIRNDIAPEELRIVDLQGTLGATAQIGRTSGLEKAAAKYGWTILDMVPADYTQAKGKEVMQRLLSEHEDINVVYAENDNEAIGAIEAIEESGRTAGTDIKNGEILVISFDAAKSGLTKVMEGKIALDVECNPLQGPEAGKIIKAVYNGNEFNKYTYVNENAFSCTDIVKSVSYKDGEYNITKLTQEIINRREY